MKRLVAILLTVGGALVLGLVFLCTRYQYVAAPFGQWGMVYKFDRWTGRTYYVTMMGTGEIKPQAVGSRAAKSTDPSPSADTRGPSPLITGQYGGH